jgi:nitric oxide reductase NorE protein
VTTQHADAFADPFREPLHRSTSRPPQPRSRGHVPGEIGIWVFIFGDMVVFSVFFGVFVVERSQSSELFEHSRETLDVTFGAVNTLLLLTGSLFVAQGVSAVRRRLVPQGGRLIALALLCGCGFVFNKALEYGAKLGAGHGPDANDFYMYFFMFTGIHLVHLLLGLVALAVMWKITRKPALDARDVRNLEAGASYWHLIDLLWIVLFALLYLMR